VYSSGTVDFKHVIDSLATNCPVFFQSPSLLFSTRFLGDLVPTRAFPVSPQRRCERANLATESGPCDGSSFLPSTFSVVVVDKLTPEGIVDLAYRILLFPYRPSSIFLCGLCRGPETSFYIPVYFLRASRVPNFPGLLSFLPPVFSFFSIGTFYT